jgi:hypothetical protein
MGWIRSQFAPSGGVLPRRFPMNPSPIPATTSSAAHPARDTPAHGSELDIGTLGGELELGAEFDPPPVPVPPEGADPFAEPLPPVPFPVPDPGPVPFPVVFPVPEPDPVPFPMPEPPLEHRVQVSFMHYRLSPDSTFQRYSGTEGARIFGSIGRRPEFARTGGFRTSVGDGGRIAPTRVYRGLAETPTAP